MKKKDISNSNLQLLIDELIKDHPNQKLVKKIMIDSGIPYSSDPITQMGQVLTVMNNDPVVDKRHTKNKGVKEL